MAEVTEIAPDLYRICVYVPDFDLQFSHCLVKDEEPLLFHTGFNVVFPDVRDAVASVIDPAGLRWIGFSHFESDECGSLNRWLELAPEAEAVCSVVGAMVNVNDFATRPAKGMAEGEVLTTGKNQFQLCRTPHLPHGWDGALMFEKTNQTLLCSDLFHQIGNVEPITESDVVGRTREALKQYQTGILADYSPYTHYTDRLLQELSTLKPRTLAIMHGSSFTGDGEGALKDLASVFREVLGDDSAGSSKDRPHRI